MVKIELIFFLFGRRKTKLSNGIMGNGCVLFPEKILLTVNGTKLRYEKRVLLHTQNFRDEMVLDCVPLICYSRDLGLFGKI